jgi:hypothetical protein
MTNTEGPNQPLTGPPSPAPAKNHFWVWIVLLVVGLVAGKLLVECSEKEDPFDIPAASDVNLDVVTCTAEHGFATAKVEITLDTPMSYVGLTGEYDLEGDSLGSGAGRLTNVVPEQVYRTEVRYGLDRRTTEGNCTVDVESDR